MDSPLDINASMDKMFWKTKCAWTLDLNTK